MENKDLKGVVEDYCKVRRYLGEEEVCRIINKVKQQEISEKQPKNKKISAER